MSLLTNLKIKTSFERLRRDEREESWSEARMKL